MTRLYFVKKFLLPSIGVTLLSLSTHAHALGSAGCGLGSLVITGNEWWKQLFAATTNGTSGSQTFGITSGTSNCAPGLFGEAQKQEDYMVANLASLQREVAQGRGDTVNGLAAVLGCEKSSYEEFGTFAQTRYSSVFHSSNPSVVLSSLKTEIRNHSSLSGHCQLVNI